MSTTEEAVPVPEGEQPAENDEHDQTYLETHGDEDDPDTPDEMEGGDEGDSKTEEEPTPETPAST